MPGDGAHTFNPSTQQVEAGKSRGQHSPGQPGLHREMLSLKTKTQQQTIKEPVFDVIRKIQERR